MLDFEVSKVEPCEILVLRHHMPCYVGQFLEVAPRASALHVVAKTLLQVGTACPKALARAAELLTQFDLPKTLRQLCLIAFSGDQQQRVNLACGFGYGYLAQLLDGPTAGLDGTNRDVLLEMNLDVKASGDAIVGSFGCEAVWQRVCDHCVDVTCFLRSVA